MPFVTYKLMTRDNLRKRKIMKHFCIFFREVTLKKEMQKNVRNKNKNTSPYEIQEFIVIQKKERLMDDNTLHYSRK
jgi:hypothetical protein